jgi:hypothetical protein
MKGFKKLLLMAAVTVTSILFALGTSVTALAVISVAEETSVNDTVTIRAYVPEYWGAPNIWAWSAADGTNVFEAWRGQAVVQDGDWYELEVPAWVNSVIINDGTTQTSDITVEPGKDVWVVVQPDIDNTFKGVVGYSEIDLTQYKADAPTETPTASPASEDSKAYRLMLTSIITGAVVLLYTITVIIVVVVRKNHY